MPDPRQVPKKTITISVPESHVPSIRRWLKAVILDNTDRVMEDFLFDVHQKLGEPR